MNWTPKTTPVKKLSNIPDSNFSSSFGIFNPEPKVIYPKYYKKLNESCPFVVFWADWAMGAVLKISTILLQYLGRGYFISYFYGIQIHCGICSKNV